MTKKEREIKGVTGKDITHIDGYNTWITCTTDDGIKFSINFKMLFEILDGFEFNIQRYGDRFRAIEFYRGEGEL